MGQQRLSMPVSRARSHLAALIKLSRRRDIIITHHRRPRAVILSNERYVELLDMAGMNDLDQRP